MKWCLMTKKPPPPDLRLAGKERGLNGRVYPVLLHGIDAVAFCFALWRHHVAPGLRTTIAGALGVDEDTAVRVLAYWTGLHDVGKIDAFFQANRLGLTIPDGYLQAEGSSHGHATLGCQWLSMVLPETGYPPLDDEDPSPDWSLNSSVATTGATPNPRRNNSTPVSTTGSPKTHGTVSVTPTSTASGTSWTPRQLRPAWTHPPP